MPRQTRWGAYDLQREDNDSAAEWAGARRFSTAGHEVPAPGTDGFVHRLQQDLREVGFLLVGTPDGDFGPATQWAVREFQAYAKMDRLTVEAVPGQGPAVYGDRLSQVVNTTPYTGPVSGVLNDATRVTLTQWLRNRWRCPVVIEARQGATVVHENLWNKDDLKSTGPRMFARDWSGHYTLPPGVAPGDRVVLGDWVPDQQSGPSSRAPIHTLAGAEITPDALIGLPLNALTPAQLSTFKAIRAVSEVECMGYLDSLTAWDNAVMSLGPCHWTLAVMDQTGFHDGELCAYLALLRHFEAHDFEQAVGFFGTRPSNNWLDATGAATGASLFTSGSRKYVAWMEYQREGGGYATVPRNKVDADFFRTWHWFHRFSMAGRTVTGFRRRMWDMARIRLRDIRATPWSIGPPAVPDLPVPGNQPRPATIGDVITSERGLAMLMRWHVRFPSHVIEGGHAGKKLYGALKRAAVQSPSDAPDQWDDVDEQRLIDGLTAEAAAVGNANLISTLRDVRTWHTWSAGGGPRRYSLPHTIADLSAERNSLQFDATGLPPPP